MKNKSFKKLVSSLLIAVMLFSSFGVVFGATASTDVKGHWAESQISAWIDKGLIKGYEDGSFKPDNSITRAEFIALINRSFGFTEAAAISFSDIAASNWAYAEVAKAVKAGYITGYADGTIGASKPISRQEVAVIVDRLLGLSDKESAATSFTDSSTIALWAKGSVDAAVAKGILKGYAEDNSFKPSKSITRAEAVVTLDRAVAAKTTSFNVAGAFGPATGTETINGDVAINVAGVTLQNTIITGKLLFAAGIGEGDAFLNNVTVLGETTVQGGGVNSIHFKDSKLLTIIINKPTGTVRIVAEGTTTVDQVNVSSPVTIQETDTTGKGFGNIILNQNLPKGSDVTLKGSFDNVTVLGDGAKLDLPEGTTITKFKTDEDVTVTGKGTITTAELGKDSKTTFETKPTTTTVGTATATPTPAPTASPSPSPVPTSPPSSGDTTEPTASVTSYTYEAGVNVPNAQSTEIGTIYLVLDSADITSVSAAESAVTGGTAAKATVSAANADTSIATTGLGLGEYKVVAVDAAGNFSVESNGTITLVDTTAPATPIITSVAGLTPTSGKSNDNTPNVIIGNLEIGVTAYVYDGSTSVGTGVATGTSLTITTSSLSDGVHIITVKVKDASNNLSSASGAFTYTLDTIVPTVLLTSPAISPINAAFTVTATFSEAVTGFDAGDILVTNAAKGTFTAVSPTEYTLVVNPSSNGPVTVNVAGATAQDLAGNNNTAATQLSVTYDGTRPTVTLTSNASNPTGGTFTVTATFSEPVTGFDINDVSVTNGTYANFAGSSSVYTFDVTPGITGSVNINVAGLVAIDSASNGNTAASQLSVNYDSSILSVALSKTVGNATYEPFTVTATFSQPVYGFDESGFGVDNGSTSDFQVLTDSKYTVLITPASEGNVTVSIDDSVAQSIASDFWNLAAIDLQVEYDTTVPTVALTTGTTSPTNAATFIVTATFSEAVTGFTATDIMVSNGTKGTFTPTSGTVYTLVITPSGDGAVTADVTGSVAQDAAGNDNTAASQLSIISDKTAPTVALTTGTTSPTNAATFIVTATFSEAVTGFTATDITVSNGTKGTFTPTSGTVYSLVITPSGDGAVTADVTGSVAQDAVGNDNTAASQLSIISDKTAPTVALTTGTTSPTNAATFIVTATFSEAVTGFTATDITVSNGTKGTFTPTSGTVYTLVITPSGDGAVTADVTGSVAQDAAGNDNTAASQLSIISDKTVPTVVLTTGTTSPTNAATFIVTATFSEAVTGFTATDIMVSNGTKGTFTPTSGTVYTLVITPSGDGAVTADVTGSVAQDAAGNDNTAASQLSIISDKTAPTVALTTGTTSPTNAATFIVTATFSEAVTGFTATDITVSNGTKGTFTPTSGTVYSLVITPSGDGAVTADVTGSVAQDAVGNDNTAASQLSIISDKTAPTVALTTGTTSPTNATTFIVTATFSEAVTGFTATDITVSNGTKGTFTPTSGTVYTLVITPSGDGAVTADVTGSVAQDAAGNDNTAASQLSIISDKTVPTVVLTTGTTSPTNAATFIVTATFSEAVTGFTATDIMVSNGTKGTFTPTSGTVYTLVITPSGDGAVTADVTGSVAQDAAGNDNTAASQLSIISDKTVPTVVLTTGTTSPTNAATFIVTATFSEAVTGFTATDITVSNGTKGTFTPTSGTVYSLVITPSGDGAVTADVTGSVAQDAAGNDNTAASQLSIISDKTAPTVASAVFSDAVTLVITFSEEVVASLSDFTNGTIVNGGSGDATSYNISAVAGSGTNIITLTIAGNTPIQSDDSSTVDIGNTVLDTAGNSITAVVGQAVTGF
ncbi:S-layer homology domain-containing protein [Paenibacillus psychroresistens]|uniref:S-layer homology domain-containing protein n=1 Tax=Paenibacillus psychroresistens TaxID=1778678 RepID=A0A6B8RQ40_9BACL|nr:Ig-like domain-containing protein [Paenibacillus psychroresistens]QGQ97957.1 S-layer homology domain-containing protein [Paenibacillus psychroresistens]